MAELHPQIVHFTIALAFLGVAFRLISLIGRPAFAGPTAAVLLILAALFGFFATQSGAAAHGPVERAPGARRPVTDHEAWGERAGTCSSWSVRSSWWVWLLSAHQRHASPGSLRHQWV